MPATGASPRREREKVIAWIRASWESWAATPVNDWLSVVDFVVVPNEEVAEAMNVELLTPAGQGHVRIPFYWDELTAPPGDVTAMGQEILDDLGWLIAESYATGGFRRA